MEMLLIESRNRRLWETINQNFEVIIEKHAGNHFYHHFVDKKVILFVPEAGGTIELMTHQLLHLYLATKGINMTEILKQRFRNEPLLRWSLNENLFDQIGECLEHWKMLPLYLKMKFERDLFCESYYMPCCNEISMQIIRSGMNKKVPTKISVHHFVHKYFTMKTCLNPAFYYEEQLDELKFINGDLYLILDNFQQIWNAYEIGSRNGQSLATATTNFIHELGMWNIMNIYAKEKNVRA